MPSIPSNPALAPLSVVLLARAWRRAPGDPADDAPASADTTSRTPTGADSTGNEPSGPESGSP